MNDLGNLITEGNGKGNGAIWLWVVVLLFTAVGSFVCVVWLQNMQSDLINKSGASIGALIYNTELKKSLMYLKYCSAFCVAVGIFCALFAPLVGRAISKTEIKVYERGIVGKGLSKWFCIGDIRILDFMLTYSQASVDLSGGYIIVHGPGANYNVYVKNGHEIQDAIFKQKNEKS